MHDFFQWFWQLDIKLRPFKQSFIHDIYMVEKHVSNYFCVIGGSCSSSWVGLKRQNMALNPFARDQMAEWNNFETLMGRNTSLTVLRHDVSEVLLKWDDIEEGMETFEVPMPEDMQNFRGAMGRLVNILSLRIDHVQCQLQLLAAEKSKQLWAQRWQQPRRKLWWKLCSCPVQSRKCLSLSQSRTSFVWRHYWSITWREFSQEIVLVSCGWKLKQNGSTKSLWKWQTHSWDQTMALGWESATLSTWVGCFGQFVSRDGLLRPAWAASAHWRTAGQRIGYGQSCFCSGLVVTAHCLRFRKKGGNGRSLLSNFCVSVVVSNKVFEPLVSFIV